MALNKASYQALSDPLEAMLNRLQEKKLRKQLSDDQMAQLAEKYRLEREAQQEERVAKAIDEDIAYERSLGTAKVKQGPDGTYIERTMPIKDLPGQEAAAKPKSDFEIYREGQQKGNSSSDSSVKNLSSMAKTPSWFVGMATSPGDEKKRAIEQLAAMTPEQLSAYKQLMGIKQQASPVNAAPAMTEEEKKRMEQELKDQRMMQQLRMRGAV